MIPDFLTNTVYLADTLQQDKPAECKTLLKILEEHNISVNILKGTRDWYCRDYMPIQTEKNRFVQFVFQPTYFKTSEYHLLTNPVHVSLSNELPKPIHSRIILDGGNVVKWNDKVIITDKVFEDNRYQFNSNNEIRKELEKALQCRVIIIPRHPDEETGHADGLVRFIDDNHVIVNDKKGEPLEWVTDFYKTLKMNGLEPIEIPCTASADQKTGKGLYINYLQVGNLVVVPQFDQTAFDKQALDIMKELMGYSYNVIAFEANWISKHGGVFNCATWTVASE